MRTWVDGSIGSERETNQVAVARQVSSKEACAQTGLAEDRVTGWIEEPAGPNHEVTSGRSSKADCRSPRRELLEVSDDHADVPLPRWCTHLITLASPSLIGAPTPLLLHHWL
eukprot:4855193-Pyramimonas_sp.AAC.1